MKDSGQEAASAASVVEILEKARGRVAKGWRQGGDDYGNPDASACCALGAIRVEARFAGESWWNLFALAADLLRAAAATEWLPKWNDTPGRTQAQVLAAYDRAIVLAKTVIEDASKTPKENP